MTQLRLLSIATAGALSALTVTSQNLIINDAPTSSFNEVAAVSPMFPGGGPLANTYGHAPALPPPAGPLAGAVTIDTMSGETWYTDGFTLAVMNHNAYRVRTLPAITMFPAPSPAGPAGPPLTGMALDPITNTLWVTDGTWIGGAVPVPPPPPPAPPVTWNVPPAPAGFQITAPPLTGLEWDSLSNSLWACDQLGFVYNFTPAPPYALMGLIPPRGPAPPVTGISIDKTGMGGIYVLGAGGLIFDYSSGVAFPTAGSGQEVGLTFHPVPAADPPGVPGGICGCPNIPALGLRLLGPMTRGMPLFGVDVTGVAPNQLVIFGFDFGAAGPAPYPVVNGLGCGLGLTFTSFGFSVWANAAGTATLPIPFTAAPIGTVLYMQNVTPCAADPLGVILTPALQVVVSAP